MLGERSSLSLDLQVEGRPNAANEPRHIHCAPGQDHRSHSIDVRDGRYNITLGTNHDASHQLASHHVGLALAVDATHVYPAFAQSLYRPLRRRSGHLQRALIEAATARRRSQEGRTGPYSKEALGGFGGKVQGESDKEGTVGRDVDQDTGHVSVGHATGLTPASLCTVSEISPLPSERIARGSSASGSRSTGMCSLGAG